MVKKTNLYTKEKKFRKGIKSWISIKKDRVIKFNQQTCLKLYTDMNAVLRKMQKIILKNIFQVE